MPDALQTFITNGYNDATQAQNAMLLARTHLTNAGTYIGNQDWANAKIQIQAASDDIGNFVKRLLQDDVFYKGTKRDWRDALQWINDNWPTDGEEYELTLDKMLTAIWDSDSLRWFHFINYIDSMRAGIWNLEIYDTHLAEWYRHFSVTG